MEKEFEWLKYVAEMRGTCDTCKQKRIMIAQNVDKWECFKCTFKEENHGKATVDN